MTMPENEDPRVGSAAQGAWIAPALPQVADPALPPTPFSLQRLFQSYRAVLTRHNLAVFDAEQVSASWPNVIAGSCILAVAWTFLFVVASTQVASIYSAGPSFGSALFIFVAVVAAVFFTLGVYHLIARQLGGTGTFLTYAYLASLAIVPAEAAGAVLLVIPFLGPLVVLVGGLYALYLTTLATQSAHHISTGKAWAVVLIPGAIAALVSCIFPVLLTALAVALTHP